MTSYRFLSAAEEEFSEADIFYDESSLGLGQAFISNLGGAINLLCKSPTVGKPVGLQFRSFSLSRFPCHLSS